MTDTDTSRMPYQLPFPPDAGDEALVSPAVPEDERIWVPQADGLDFRPLLLHTTHRHPMPVTGYVIKGRWHYLEHDWMAEPGAFLFEPPGETHTLVVPEGETEMITMFQVNGCMIYVDPWGETTGYEDVFTKIDMCRRHYAEVGLGAGYTDQFIR